MRDFTEFSGTMKDWPRLETIPGAKEILAVLHANWILAVATIADYSDEKDIRAVLQRVDLDWWLDKVYCFKKIWQKKPSLEFYHYILNDLKLTPLSIFMVGDDYEADVLGANRCGIRAVLFNNRDGEDRRTDMLRTIHQLDDLPAVVAGWN